MLLRQKALVLRLQVGAPRHRELERLARLRQDVHGFGVRQPDELAADDAFQRADGGRLDALDEELHVLGAAFQDVAEDALEERLGEVHVVVEFEEGHLRFDHPELGEVARGVGVLGPEGRAEGVDLAERRRRFRLRAGR